MLMIPQKDVYTFVRITPLQEPTVITQPEFVNPFVTFLHSTLLIILSDNVLLNVLEVTLLIVTADHVYQNVPLIKHYQSILMEIKATEFVNLNVKLDGCHKTLLGFVYSFVPKINLLTLIKECVLINVMVRFLNGPTIVPINVLKTVLLFLIYLPIIQLIIVSFVVLLITGQVTLQQLGLQTDNVSRYVQLIPLGNTTLLTIIQAVVYLIVPSIS